ncbi:MAG: hypothetical protein OWV35_06260 [Firmicutes bacterium]|nr:hypothetical protein [Bacillota bacterium]
MTGEQSGIRDAVEVETQELLDMARSTFDSLLEAMTRMGGGRLAENLRDMAAAMSTGVLGGTTGMREAGALGAELWNRWAAELAGAARSLGTLPLPDWLAALAAGQPVSATAAAEVARAWVQQLSERWGPELERGQEAAVQALDTWIRSEAFARSVETAARLQELGAFLTGPEMARLTAALRQAGPHLADLMEALSDPRLGAVVEAALGLARQPAVRRLLEVLGRQGEVLDRLARALDRMTVEGGLDTALQLLDSLSTMRVDAGALGRALENLRAAAAQAERLHLSGLLDRLAAALDASVAEAARDRTRYGAVRLLGTLKDPAVQEGVKLGLALLRHLPEVLGAASPKALPGTPSAS